MTPVAKIIADLLEAAGPDAHLFAMRALCAYMKTCHIPMEKNLAERLWYAGLNEAFVVVLEEEINEYIIRIFRPHNDNPANFENSFWVVEDIELDETYVSARMIQRDLHKFWMTTFDEKKIVNALFREASAFVYAKTAYYLLQSSQLADKHYTYPMADIAHAMSIYVPEDWSQVFDDYRQPKWARGLAIDFDSVFEHWESVCD